MFTVLSMMYVALTSRPSDDGFSVRLYNMYDGIISKALPKSYSNAKTNVYMFFIIGLGLSGSLLIDQLINKYISTVFYYVFTLPMTFIFNLVTNKSVDQLSAVWVIVMLIAISVILRVGYWVYCLVIESLEDNGAYDSFYYDFKGVSHNQYTQYKAFKKTLKAMLSANKIDESTEFYRFLIYLNKLNARQFAFMDNSVWVRPEMVFDRMNDLIQHDQVSWLYRIIDSDFYEMFYKLMSHDEYNDMAKKQYAKSMGIEYSDDNMHQKLYTKFIEKKQFISDCIGDVLSVYTMRVHEENRYKSYTPSFYGVYGPKQTLNRFLLSEGTNKALNELSVEAQAKELD